MGAETYGYSKDVKQILRMKEGDEEFSYAQNSTIQGKLLPQVTKPLIECAIRSLLSNNNNARPLKVLNIADFGCGVGTTSLALRSMLIDVVSTICKELKVDNDQVPEIQIYMNDLPLNDFNVLFKKLEELKVSKEDDSIPSCFIMGAPGSFYSRVFPQDLLHIVHSNYALHWISKVPLGVYDGRGRSLNKGNTIVSETSPKVVVDGYRAQFRQDFSSFLKCRSREVVTNGYMILALVGSPSVVPEEQSTTKLLTQAIFSLVSKGLIEEDRANSFDMPLYFPAKEEIQTIVMEEGSFAIEKMETLVDNVLDKNKDFEANVKAIAKTLWAALEPLVSYHFGVQVYDVLFDELTRVIIHHLENHNLYLFNIIVMLRKQMN